MEPRIVKCSWCMVMCHIQVICSGLATETLQLKEELFRAIDAGKREMKCAPLLPRLLYQHSTSPVISL